MKAYLAAPIFTERDRNFNSYLEAEILKRCPELDLYLAQNNASINDKEGCATSADIYVGDVTRLKEADMVITIMSADMPPIGSSYETAYFCGLCEQASMGEKYLIALYDDCREAQHTYSTSKKDAMASGIAESQFPYINLLAVGYVKKWGSIYFKSEELIDAVEKAYKIFTDDRQSGIYKITNLKNGLCYIGATKDFHKRWLAHKREGTTSYDSTSELHADMREIGLDYFKFEIIEKCDISELSEREKYWIAKFDSCDQGYNKETGGVNIKSDDEFESSQTTEVYSYNLDGTFYKKYLSISSALRDLGLKSNNITRAIQANDNKHISGNKMWRMKYYDRIEPYEPPNRGKGIFAYDIETREFVKGYENGRQAGIELTGKRQPHINDCAMGNRNSCCGFIWAYDYFDRLPLDYFGNKVPTHKYVYFDSSRNKWCAYPRVNKKSINLGRYDTENEAIEVVESYLEFLEWRNNTNNSLNTTLYSPEAIND